MTGHYVTVHILGRNGFLLLADWALTSGIEMDYCAGGWHDMEYDQVESHIKFVSREDALAYILVHGGTYQTTVPTRKPAQ